ncbi:CDP-alcohol phosphatidyltransferase family protein [Candidatus Woesearchaeota archaeon]|nr:CDP-alcohol phosphatidyltransferase family protein [Candidatus Woesearchaeota archaeon]
MNKKYLVLPNILSIIRLIFSPFIIYLSYLQRYNPALALFILISLTDVLDGYYARKNKECTPFGSVLDSTADKVTIFCVMIALYIKNVPNYILIIFGIMIFLGIIKIIEMLYHLKKSDKKILNAKLSHLQISRINIFLIYAWLGLLLLEFQEIENIKYFFSSIIVLIMTIITAIYNAKEFFKN